MNRLNIKKLWPTIALALLASCTTDVEQEAQQGGAAIRLTAEEQTAAAPTRAASTADLQNTAFAAGEDVAVYVVDRASASTYAATPYRFRASAVDGAGHNALTYYSDATTASVLCYPITPSASVDIYGFYPYSLFASVSDRTTDDLAFSVSADQSTADAYRASDVMMAAAITNQARTESTVNLQFSHLMSKLVVRLKQGVHAGSSSAVTAAELAGSTLTIGGVTTEATLDMTDGTVTTGSNSTTVTLASDADLAFYYSNSDAAISTTEYAIVLPAQALTGKTVTLTTSAGETITGTLPEIDLTVGGSNVLTLTVNDSGIEATRTGYGKAAIKKWQTTSLNTITSAYTVQDGEELTGTLTSKVKISIADGAVVTLNNVTINGENSYEYKWAGINCQGNATIVLADGTTNNVKGFYDDCPGIYVPKGATLTILGTGTLNASSNGGDGAGIGSGDGTWSSMGSCGNIDIQNGIVNASSNGSGAGIGSGDGGSCGKITISGGTVTASSKEEGAGIGSGDRGSCGNITISGGTVEASSNNFGAGIGSGDDGSCNDITISGGNVTASAKDGAGIGSGYRGSCGNITISGGNVTASSELGAAGIGSGDEGSCDDITISGGTVEASANNFGAGIGSGWDGSCDDITISGGTVTASSEECGAGIGSGESGSCGTITISGGNVTASAKEDGAGIGCGDDGSCGDITILNTVTKVTATKGSGAIHSIGAYDSRSTIGTVTIGGVEGAISTSPYTYQP